MQKSEVGRMADKKPLYKEFSESTAYLPDLGSLPPQLYGKGYTY